VNAIFSIVERQSGPDIVEAEGKDVESWEGRRNPITGRWWRAGSNSGSDLEVVDAQGTRHLAWDLEGPNLEGVWRMGEGARGHLE